MSEASLTQCDALEDLLKKQFRSKVRNVRVVEREGKYVVQGTAVSYYAKQLVQHLVLSILQARPFVNELEVSPPSFVADGA